MELRSTIHKLPIAENPSCLHTTVASGADQKSSHTVPHVMFMQISTRPSRMEAPPTRRIAPGSQTVEMKHYCTHIELYTVARK